MQKVRKSQAVRAERVSQTAKTWRARKNLRNGHLPSLRTRLRAVESVGLQLFLELTLMPIALTTKKTDLQVRHSINEAHNIARGKVEFVHLDR